MFDYLRQLYKQNPNSLESYRLKILNKLTELAYYTGNYLFAWLEIPDIRNRYIWQQYANEESPLTLVDDILVYTFKSVESITVRQLQNRKQVSGIGSYQIPSTQEHENDITIVAYDIYGLQLTRMHSLWFDLNNKTKNDWFSLDVNVSHNTRILGNMLLIQTTPDLRYIVSAVQLIGIEPIQDPIPIAISGSVDAVTIREIQIQYYVTHIRKLYVHNQDLWQWFLVTFLERSPYEEQTQGKRITLREGILHA